MKFIYVSVFTSTLLILSGCIAIAPSSIIDVPVSARPKVVALNNPSNGTIFQSDNFKPIFEDRRARTVGDLLTILVSEKSSVDKTNASSGANSGSFNSKPGQLFGLPLSTSSLLSLNGSSSINSSNKSAGSASYNFSTTMGVTVIEVLTNGNLVVSGEKQIGLDRGSEFVRFSGVVAVSSIGAGNSVLSTQVADARIEYRTNTQIDQSQMTSMMNRFFYSVLPL
jgi:flagellar L-ring protein precursor FlgH